MGRAGQVQFTDDDGSLVMDYEFGGGNCIAIVNLPSEESWEAQGRRADQRSVFFHQLGHQLIKDQAPHGHFTIEGDTLLIWDGNKG